MDYFFVRLKAGATYFQGIVPVNLVLLNDDDFSLKIYSHFGIGQGYSGEILVCTKLEKGTYYVETDINGTRNHGMFYVDESDLKDDKAFQALILERFNQRTAARLGVVLLTKISSCPRD